ncbi:ferredoxin--NADP reductase [Idiomarina aquatica]|uniref:ferredoxin--NADP(+) reductase n=1 Tax=Idiomarina aquatica TaxID=1327752 RepID=A0AA94EH98_9GAMM|nr:ferredoxin--NADP reductase [Idiomarina aquatica]RUO45790.1 ferredoxin--NADP(+) reductase [Idiomarina aquatica]
MVQLINGKVVENYRWSDNVFSLRIIAEPFDFKAGQFVRLGLPGGDAKALRAYSLASPPGASVIDFVIAEVADGLTSPQLAKLKPGDSVTITQPASGFFTLDEVPDGDDLWLLSTGTGIGPFISMLHTEQPWRRFRRINLVHGVRTAADLVYQEQIQHWQQQYPDRLGYQPVITREQIPGALNERIPQLLESGKLEAALATPLTTNSQVMLCGNPDMITECRGVLAAKGLAKNTRRKPGNVTSENYW